MVSLRARTLGATFVTLALAYGVWYSYAVFLVALLREFGWSRTVVAGGFSLFTLVHGTASFPIGWLSDRVGPRRLVLGGGLVLAAALALDGAVTRPWQLYLAFGVATAVGVAAAGWVPAAVLVQRWFPERVGTALGLTSAGIGVGIFLVVPLCQWLIELAGWRWAFRILGGLVLAWVVPATLWLVRDPPAAGARAAGPPAGGGDVTLGGAVGTARFWLLGAAPVFCAFATQMLLVHQAAYLVDHGLPALVAASVVSVVGLSSIVGKTGGGWASDTFGREPTFSFGMACVVASVAVLGLLALTGATAWAFLYGALVGVGYSVTAPLMPAVISDLYRGRNFGVIFGALHVANAVGGSSGPWVAGRVFDATGSYAAAFTGAVAAAALSTGALWLVAPRRARRAGS
ncbi:MAG TPA: MFS transporter [Methylomirabilota bacterium]|nr:MFS transporter [Methylomirabilota bacterium]